MKVQSDTLPTLLAILTNVLIGQALAQSSDIGWQPNPKLVESLAKKHADTIYEESRVPEFRLPDPLALDGGGTIGEPEEWLTERRPVVMQRFREHVYGVRPATAYEVGFEEVGRREDAFGIGATARQIRATIRAQGRSLAFDFVIAVPRAEGPVPLVVLINNRYLIPLDKAVDDFDPFWPVEKMLRRGYATVALHTSHVDPDKPDGYASGVRALLDDSDSDPLERWGSLSAWGWAASRVLDFALEGPQIDPKRTAIVGHSRGGKTALWAGAEDERFKVVYSNNSGCGGAALSRRAFGETVARITKVFPRWFCGRFKSYAGSEGDLPVDQHQLIGLIAPRAVYVASADEDLWADPRGEYAAVLAGGPVFALLGKRHIAEPGMPALDAPRHVGSTGYHIRSGAHNLTEQDWGYFLDFADGVFDK